MPLFYQKNLNDKTKLAIWRIDEPEEFFIRHITLSREISHPHKRLQHLAGRYMLPFLFPDFPYTQIEIADTRKPFLPDEQYHFSISHCQEYAAVIVSSAYRVGVDVEFVTERLHKIKSKFLHAEEMRFVNSLQQHKQTKVLSILWSAKEAMYKWYGKGKVDFSEMMRVLPFIPGEAGEIHAAFINTDLQQQLILNYMLVDNLTLVWVVSDFE